MHDRTHMEPSAQCSTAVNTWSVVGSADRQGWSEPFLGLLLLLLLLLLQIHTRMKSARHVAALISNTGCVGKRG